VSVTVQEAPDQQFYILLETGVIVVSVRLPLDELQNLKKMLKNFADTTRRRRNQNSKNLKVSFFKTSAEYFYVEWKPTQNHISFHIDNIGAILEALNQFDGSKKAEVKLPHP
jgi:hypothetical protein